MSPPQAWQPAVRLDAVGMRRLFGPLEADVMEVLWRECPVSAPQVRAALPEAAALNTVVTVLGRLTAKGVLLRSGTRRHYRYAPTVGRDDFVAGVARRLVAGMVGDFGDVAAAAFAQAAVAPAPARGADRRGPS